MKKFSDFARAEPLDGDKIKIQEVLGKEIKVLDYKIAASKFPSDGNGKRLTLQIEIDDIHRIIFTGSMTLMGAGRALQRAAAVLATIRLAGRQFIFS